jgi:hypothetical protein
MKFIDMLYNHFYNKTRNFDFLSQEYLPSFSTDCCSLFVNDLAINKLTVDIELFVVCFSRLLCWEK